jgi:hypothetical protein
MGARLHQNVQDLTFTIDRAPQIHAFVVDRNEELIQTPAHICTRMCFSQRPGVGETKLDRPTTDDFMRHIDATLG